MKTCLYGIREENYGKKEWLQHQNVHLLSLNILDTYRELGNGDRVK